MDLVLHILALLNTNRKYIMMSANTLDLALTDVECQTQSCKYVDHLHFGNVGIYCF